MVDVRTMYDGRDSYSLHLQLDSRTDLKNFQGLHRGKTDEK